MAVNEDYLNFILEQLSIFGEFYTKPMFGGVSFFKDGCMFALIGHSSFYLRVTDSNRSDFESRGMTAFLATPEKKGLPYWEVPIEVIEDKDELAKWANKAYDVALKAKK